MFDELLDEFWEWFKDEFQYQEPENTIDAEYKHLFKKFWDEKFYDAWDEIKHECYDKHCEMYEPDEGGEVDAAYDRWVDQQMMDEKE